MKKLLPGVLITIFFLLVGTTVYLNISKQLAVDRKKLPEKVEYSNGFQRWITNLKKKGFIANGIEADEFRLKEENEIYNTKWIKIYSLDEPGKPEELNRMLLAARNTDNIVFAPSDREYIDFRNYARDGYQSNEVRLYGQKEDKIIDARILDCSIRANCYYDRGYFLDNDVFVISEISRTIDKKDETAGTCLPSQECEYSFKIHLVDLINNKRWIYESKPFNAVLDNVIPML